MKGYNVPHVMKQNTDADDGRTETNRFDADDVPFDASDLIEGDRIDPSLVARTMDALDTSMDHHGDVKTQLAEATITDRMEDVHTAVLVDGETGVMVRASRHDSQSAWSQEEADWKVHDIGTSVGVTNAEWDDLDEDADPDKQATAWAEVVLEDRANGHDGYSDEITVDSRTIELKNPYEAERAYGTIELLNA